MTSPAVPPPEYPPWDFIYVRVADAIAARIAAGYYTVRLPSERELAREFGVSYLTMRHSARLLRERGLIISVHGKGTFVAPGHQPDDPSPQPSAPGQPSRLPGPAGQAPGSRAGSAEDHRDDQAKESVP